MTDWARSTIAKTRMWTSAVKAAEQQAEANVGTHREPMQLRRTLSRLGSWYGMPGCRLLALPQNPLVRRVGLSAEIVQSMCSSDL
jgi:hypothetical protein